MWACTSASFIVGRRGAERQAEAIAEVAKVPASTTSLAFARALSALGLTRVSVLAPYPEAASRAFVAFLGEWGIEVEGFLWLDALNGFDSALIPAEVILRAARDTDRRGAEALLIPDTALSTMSIVDELERVLGKTVLTANQVTIWEGLRLAGASLTVAGHGRLLATAPSEVPR
jgi:maleate cis-trans isomerase